MSCVGRVAKYNTLVLVGGNYNDWDKAVVAKIKEWVNAGGTLITFQTATAWAIRQELAHASVLDPLFADRRGGAEPPPTATSPATATPNNIRRPAADTTHPADTTALRTRGRRGGGSGDRLDYDRQTDVEGAKRVNGAIFQSDLDITHPLAFGINDRRLFINKNGPTILLPGTNKYSTVAKYTADAFVNGYASKESIAKVNNSAAIVTSSEGAGTVILFADDPTYRSYWLGTNRIFLNALFFANLLNGGFGGGAE